MPKSMIRGDLETVNIGKYSVIGKRSIIRPPYKRIKGCVEPSRQDGTISTHYSLVCVTTKRGVRFFPLVIGDCVHIEEDCVISAASIGSHVHIGKGSVIVSLWPTPTIHHHQTAFQCRSIDHDWIQLNPFFFASLTSRVTVCCVIAVGSKKAASLLLALSYRRLQSSVALLLYRRVSCPNAFKRCKERRATQTTTSFCLDQRIMHRPNEEILSPS